MKIALLSVKPVDLPPTGAASVSVARHPNTDGLYAEGEDAGHYWSAKCAACHRSTAGFGSQAEADRYAAAHERHGCGIDLVWSDSDRAWVPVEE